MERAWFRKVLKAGHGSVTFLVEAGADSEAETVTGQVRNGSYAGRLNPGAYQVEITVDSTVPLDPDGPPGEIGATVAQATRSLDVGTDSMEGVDFELTAEDRLPGI